MNFVTAYRASHTPPTSWFVLMNRIPIINPQINISLHSNKKKIELIVKLLTVFGTGSVEEAAL